MKLLFVSIMLIIPRILLADTVGNKKVLARYSVQCNVNSDTDQGSVEAKLDGIISVFDQQQAGQLRLGVIGSLTLVADFQFDLNSQDDGAVIFSIQGADGSIFSKKHVSLPRNGFVETTVYYFDAASSTTATAECSLRPASPN